MSSHAPRAIVAMSPANTGSDDGASEAGSRTGGSPEVRALNALKLDKKRKRIFESLEAMHNALKDLQDSRTNLQKQLRKVQSDIEGQEISIKMAEGKARLVLEKMEEILDD